ncbi:hypothetical protein HAHE_10950 [Haloferula helveola]|uniref:Uncharacterized protein n=1 Tax=Haloferula helveola TaxID=490095 RepID=A0ABN6H0V7_9BACT|nr:hypothetical protein HAHE_10950 [Haloferula helveola]
MTERRHGGLSVGGYVLAGLLVVMLAVFVLGHVWSAGAVWNHLTGEIFSPWRNWVSDYAYRSPAWPIFVGCMYGFAIVLAAVSLKVFGRSRGAGLIAWLMTLLLGYAALKLVEVAAFPVKPPEVSIEELQSRMDESSWQRFKGEMLEIYRGLRGHASPRRGSAWETVAAFESNTGHYIGIRAGMGAMLAAIALGILLPFGARWRLGTAVCLGIAVAGAWCTRFELHGLFQRVAFLGIYLWMWLGVVTLFRRQPVSPLESR